MPDPWRSFPSPPRGRRLNRLGIKLKSTSGPTTVAGRVGATLFFLAWTAIPTIGLVLMVRQVVRESAPWFWKQADCTVLESGVKEVGSDGDYTIAVRYSYAAGKLSALEAPTLTSSQYARGYRGSSDYSDAQ